MYCKTIILSNSENVISNAPKGILTLSSTSSGVLGKIRLYNLEYLPQNTRIGLYVQDKVHTSTLTKRLNHYEFSLDEKLDLNGSVYCALIDNSHGDKRVVLEGGTGFSFTDSPFDAVLEAKDEDLEAVIDNALKDENLEQDIKNNFENEKFDESPKTQQSNLDSTNQFNRSNTLKNHTHPTCDTCNQCENCEYKKYFYANYTAKNVDYSLNQTLVDNSTSPNTPNQDEFTQIDNDIIENLNPPEANAPTQSQNTIDETQYLHNESEEDDDLNADSYILSNLNEDNNPENVQDLNKKEIDEEASFLNDIIYQLDEMFANYPADDLLNSIIPSSRFVKVEGENISPYVLGVIYEDKMMKYIAYGVPAKYNSLPPADLGTNYQWLPLNPDDVMSDGYYMIYQNALTGKIVELILK